MGTGWMFFFNSEVAKLWSGGRALELVVDELAIGGELREVWVVDNSYYYDKQAGLLLQVGKSPVEIEGGIRLIECDFLGWRFSR